MSQTYQNERIEINSSNDSVGYQLGLGIRRFWNENPLMAYFILSAVVFWFCLLMIKVFYSVIARLIGTFIADVTIAYRKRMLKEENGFLPMKTKNSNKKS